MKKIIALLLACMMIVGVFAGCDSAEEGATKGTEAATQAGTEAGTEPGTAAGTGSVYYLNYKPEFNDALTELAKTYTEKTGVEVKIVTAAAGDYNNTLTSNINDVTIFNIGNTAALNDWDEYALDLTDSAIAGELTTNDFNLYNEAGELKAIGNCYESFGIIVNTKLLKDAGYELTDITDFESLKKVVEDIHGRA